MTDTLSHRGPDGSGYWHDNYCALGHRRLSIIDLDSGQQPMHSHDKRLSISFNGEIYNYRDIRADLSDYPFRNHSDTETILALYQQYGIEGFTRLRGMFAFALWDSANNTGYLVRDPLGIKPLFVHQKGLELSFASEAKALIKNSGSKLDPSALHLLMNFRYLPGSNTLFKGITQLAPGHVLKFSSGSVTTRKLSWPTHTSSSDILETLNDSVHYHLTADVPVGTYLSGGVDSAAITTLATRYNNTLQTFTLSVGDDPEEAKNAHATAKMLGLKNIQGDFASDIDEPLKKLIWNLETPKVNALQVASIAQLSSQHVKVALSGLGGDELFYGYNVHQLFYRAIQASNLPHFMRTAAGLGSKLLSGQSTWSEPQRALLMLNHAGNWPKVYGLLRNIWDDPVLRQTMYAERMLDERLPDAYRFIEDSWPQNEEPMAAMAKFEYDNKMVNDLLWQEDRASMAYGLEVRTPFVDIKMQSNAQQYDWKQLMPGGRKKFALKKALAEILPDHVLSRPKSGFQVNAGEFFQQNLNRLAEIYLSPERVSHYQLFNPNFIQQVRNLPATKAHRWHYFILYLMLGTHIWLEQFEQA